ncbi:MAG: hypothetical protein SOZ54_10595 [Candidatus Limiplasma sp.]|nr:hypothetical protein [Candidatus Limiplasma sp.]
MATFTNQATLTYNGRQTTSNITVGELLDVLTATKTAIDANYGADSVITYVVTLVNSGSTALTGLTVSDNLGGYALGQTTVYPLTYVADSMRYYQNGALQAAPTIVAGPPMSVSGLTVPAGGNATLVYDARVNEYAPMNTLGSIQNTVTVTGAGIANPATAQETVAAALTPDLRISKGMCPTTVTENGQITYTFMIQNLGNTAATEGVVLSDTFNPALNNLTATLNGTALTAGTNYTYDAATGQFTTTAGVITVPAATYTQDAATGVWTTTPGMSTLVVTGTL